jgi:hypothetical protein
MHLLKIISLLAISILLFSCKSEGPASPEEAFDYFKSAYVKSDGAQIEKVLSERSKEKIRAITKMFTVMDASQLGALAKKFNINADMIKNISIKDYLNIQISIGKTVENDFLNEITKYKIIGVDINNGKAVGRLENGMELAFVKEGGFWKFDLEELSFRELKK